MEELIVEESEIPWSYRLSQALFVLAATGCFLIFWFAGSVVGIPAEFRHGGSLLRQPTSGGTLLSLLTLVVLFVGCTLVGSPLLRGRWHLGSLTAATAGLTAWSMRGGPMHEVLFYAPGAAVFFQLAFEVILLGAVIAGVWMYIWQNIDPEAQPATRGGIIRSVAMQTALMALIVFLLAQTDAKKQCIAAVFIAGVVSSAMIQSYAPVREAVRWYWIGPIVVGVLGYLLAYVQTQGWASGARELEGFFAPLARPLPLDYASAGMFGVLLGFWMSISDPEAEETIELPKTVAAS